MTIETYPEMDVKLVEILRWDKGNSMLLYAAQRIEELGQINHVKNECLKIAMKALKEYANTFTGVPGYAVTVLNEINARLTEPEETE